MSAREDTILRPIDPSITDENDWPDFDLVDVKVLRPGKMLYANLLDATEQNPVQVIGCLELREDKTHLLLDTDSASKRVIIDNVTHYAYGQTEDRSIELWVAGKAGWYNISPAKGYVPTFNRMVQAVDMLYYLTDQHQHGKRQLNPSFKNLCEQYVFHTHGGCETREQAAAVFADHAQFLLRRMIEDDDPDGVEWKRTNVFVHLRRQFSDIFNHLMEERSQESADETEQNGIESSTPRHDPAAVAKSQVATIYSMIQNLKDEGHLAKRRLHLDLLTERLSGRYSVSRENASKMIAARAAAVIELLDEEDCPGFRWSRYVIYRELTQVAAQDLVLSAELLNPLEPLEDSSDDEGLRHTQKSVLRPKLNSAVSGKLMGKRHRNSVLNKDIEMTSPGQTNGGDGDDDDGDDDDNDEEMEGPEDVDTPSKVRGHELIRTPLSNGGSRGRSLLPNTGSAASSLLRSVLSSDHHQTPSLATKKSDDGSSSHPLAELNKISNIWSCQMPGCSKTISTKGEQRQTDIEAHATEHDWEAQMRIEVIEAERRMHARMPVSNLMQYLLNQHVAQMRSAFPEKHPPQRSEPEEQEKSQGGEDIKHQEKGSVSNGQQHEHELHEGNPVTN
ncbi:Uncharacterized protein PECH_003400 [Penicillium ucsense]|uniref:DNA (cytosine-5)-methyltransferase 1 replication foci domain-containing protein n=1 Tax=Penicillium ucsense TaxID=2839758 RepID=A0A8J8W9K4_9EURO|nr:Uncharacterized protein PECM_000210 [Penicillium ucsense]KAF7739422.1 Uncharacterized protein PECH_003400 [Penicillium ucsense]